MFNTILVISKYWLYCENFLSNSFDPMKKLLATIRNNTYFSNIIFYPFKFFQHYRPANNGSSSGSGAPPPYPGRGGPGHGYGNGRGHYNRASNHPAEFNQLSRPTDSGQPDVQRDHRDQRDQRRYYFYLLLGSV